MQIRQDVSLPTGKAADSYRRSLVNERPGEDGTALNFFFLLVDDWRDSNFVGHGMSICEKGDSERLFV